MNIDLELDKVELFKIIKSKKMPQIDGNYHNCIKVKLNTKSITKLKIHLEDLIELYYINKFRYIHLSLCDSS